MRALLDISVIIALLDPDHVFHARAHDWWARIRKHGWASCPLTENGVIRIMSNAAYSKAAKFSAEELAEVLRSFIESTDHRFWPDNLSLLDPKIFLSSAHMRSSQITDIYLLALAVANGGRLATFDRGIPRDKVANAASANLSVIS